MYKGFVLAADYSWQSYGKNTRLHDNYLKIKQWHLQQPVQVQIPNDGTNVKNSYYTGNLPRRQNNSILLTMCDWPLMCIKAAWNSYQISSNISRRHLSLANFKMDEQELKLVIFYKISIFQLFPRVQQIFVKLTIWLS